MNINNSISALLKKNLVIAFLVINLVTVFAKEKKWGDSSPYAPLIGTNIENGELGFIDPEFSSNNYYTVSSKAFIELKINDFTAPYYWFICTVRLNIVPILEDGTNGTPYEKSLTVESNHYGNFGNFIDLQKHLILEGVKGASITVVDFEVINKDSGSSESSIPSNVVLTYTYEVERYYDLSSLSTPLLSSTTTYNATDKTLMFEWDIVEEAEGYELEWTWVDNYSATGFSDEITSDAIMFSKRDFEFNNTRIQTNSNFFSIPIVYDRGYIIYRVRPIGRFASLDSYMHKYEGQWNTINTDPHHVSDWSPCTFQIETEHNNLNWQFQASYAEQGKKKEVVSYFDGSLRNRQTVTKINTNEKAVIGEVIYDEEGRPAVEVLPVPINQSAIQYYPNFNRNLADKVYSYQDFTFPNDSICNLSAGGMKSSIGASKYYSDNNDIQDNFQDFVPKANNFPFSQTEYSLDNTGRIKKKGGVGEQHQLGSNHEMQYFYSVPSQEELNRLFGYSVGNVSHYKKNIVVDPNLQVSTSYLDPQGRTIATALSAKKPSNMIALDDEEDSTLHTTVKTDLLNKLNPDDTDTDLDNNIKFLASSFWGTNLDGLRYDSQKVFTQAPGLYRFSYKLKENTFSFLCGSNTYNYPFIYNLKFGVNNECGENKLVFNMPSSGNNYSTITSPEEEQIFRLGSYSTDEIPDDATTLTVDETATILNSDFQTAKFNDITDPDVTFTVDNTKVESYGISKKLTVDQDALEFFANDYIRKGRIDGCILAPQSPEVDTTGCFYTCEQCEKFYDYNGTPFTIDINNNGTIQSDTETFTGLTYVESAVTYYGQDAYVKAALFHNTELAELAELLPDSTSDYNYLLELLTIRYKREWELIKAECKKPCQESGYSFTNENVSSITCDNILSMVMTDMLPSGQYGIYTSDVDEEGEVDPVTTESFDVNDEIASNPLTIYNENNEIFSLVSEINFNEISWRFPHYFNANGFTTPTAAAVSDSHYFNDFGEIDYVPVTWNTDTDSFEPPLIAAATVINATNPEIPTIVNGLVAVDVENNLYKAEPQLLKNVSDFVSFIPNRESWLLSLVKYHPEFHYLDYQFKTCKYKKTALFNLDQNISTTQEVTFNSDGLDAMIGNIETYQEALDAGFLNNELTLYNNDPLFLDIHEFDGFLLTVNSTDGEVETTTTPVSPSMMLQVKRAVMLQALTRCTDPSLIITNGVTALTPSILSPNSSAYAEGYDETGLTLAQYIYSTLFCNAPGATCSVNGEVLNEATLEDIRVRLNQTSPPEMVISTLDKDRFWKMYVSYYIGLKQRVQTAFTNLYALKLGHYNDCIGKGTEDRSKVRAVLKEYNVAYNKFNEWDNAPNLDFPSSSGYSDNDDTLYENNGDLLENKQQRFIPSDSMHNSNSSAAQVGEELGATVNYENYTSTGECPNVRDLKIFLNGVFQSLITPPNPNWIAIGEKQDPNINFISQSLLESLGGNYSSQVSTITSSFVSGSPTISLQLNQGTYQTTPITLTIQENPFVDDWNTYGTNEWSITQISQLTYTSYDATNQVYNFTAVARIAGDGTPSGQDISVSPYYYREITITGTTKVILTCATSLSNTNNNSSTNGTPIFLGSNDLNCNKKDLFAQGLKELINFIKLQPGSNINNTTGYSIPNPMVNVPSFLRTFFGIQSTDNVKWVFGFEYVSGPFSVLTINNFTNKYSILVNGIQRMIYFTDLNLNDNIVTNFSIGSMINTPDNVDFLNNPSSFYNFTSIEIETSTGDVSNYNGAIIASLYSAVLRTPIPLYLTCCSPCGEWDFDGDGIGDDGIFSEAGCDTCDNRLDTDNDGVSDCNDNCNGIIDFDCDGVNNDVDICPGHDDNFNSDTDSKPNGCDNCDLIANEDQMDTDNDGVGDVCDSCPGVTNQKLDSDGDGIDDACDPTPFLIEPSCFTTNTNEIQEFEDNLRTVLNDLVQSTSVIAGTSVAVTLPSLNSFVSNCDLEIRFEGMFAELTTVNPIPDVTITNFEAKFQPNRFPHYLKFKQSISNPYFRFQFYQGELGNNDFTNIVSLDGTIIQTITSITDVTLHEDNYEGNSDGFGQPITIEGFGLDSMSNSKPFTLNTNLRPQIYVTNNGGPRILNICDFLKYNSTNLPEADPNVLSKKVENLVNRSANNSNTTNNQYVRTCNCVPQVPITAECTTQHAAYTALNIPGKTEYTPNEFCDKNLHFITAGYLYYMGVNGFNITSSTHPMYITLAQFGATPLQYGFNNYVGVVNGFNSYFAGLHNLTYLQLTNANDDDNYDNQEIVTVDTWAEYATWYLINHPEICPPATMIPQSNDFVEISNNCKDFEFSIAETYNAEAYQNYINTKKREFKKAYLDAAINGAKENFTMTYDDKEYQYTLYYYDQAGNLIQTVAPQGVDRLNLTTEQNQQINLDRKNDAEVTSLPSHSFKTKYRYNSLNQLVWQSTPDGGETRFAYDLLGRIVASQNSKQVGLSAILMPPLALSSFLKTKGNEIVNIYKTVDYGNSYGLSIDPIFEYGTAEHTLVLNGEETFSPLKNVIFGLSYNKYTDGKVDFGFIHQTDGNFVIKALGTTYPTVHSVSNGGKLKIERDNGYIRFYNDGMLLQEVTDPYYKKGMLVNFYLPQKDTKLTDLKVAYSKTKTDFSYTTYDHLGRIKEAGQFRTSFDITIDDNGKLVNLPSNSWVGVSAIDNSYPHNVSGSQVEVTKTLYDDYGPFNPDDYLSESVKNTRNRVTAILTYDVCNATKPLQENDTAIFYQYDIHGNVSEMAQRVSPSIINAPAYPSGIVKKVNYEYDLISGNVNKVYYQKDDEIDQFIHKYNYDADNRITSVETSSDGVVWENDATYLYYDHGPLAKVITGDKKVQGSDYVYSLQGWLKTVNSENMANGNKDMGVDGNYISKDAFGYSLSYFNHDYEARNPQNNQAHTVSSTTAINGTELFNGNINRMITSVRGLDEQILPTQINLYSYDQLNRIFDMQTQKGTEESNMFNPLESYRSAYTYDRNGNLQTLLRDAPKLLDPADINSEQIVSMDKFKYHYTPNTNKLTHVEDEIAPGVFTEDIDNQPTDNYKYDQIGQLISDQAEEINQINWRVDGKVKSINKYDGAYKINFFYDGLGNRIAKQITADRRGTTTTHYTRDAQGNTMAVYELGINHEKELEYNLKEHNIYGSSRLGLQDYSFYKKPTDYYRLVGDKKYELSNHLGNVLSVISDRKIVPREVILLHKDTFEEKIVWDKLNEEASIDINKERKLQVIVQPQKLSGTTLKLRLNQGKAVMFNLNVNKLEGFPTAIPIKFEIRNPVDKGVLWSTTVPEDGIVSGSFTAAFKSEYLVTVSTNNTTEDKISLTVDDFYAYELPSSTTDFVSLYLPDVLAYNDYYPFGSLVPNRHGSLDSYRYGFQGQEKDDEIKGEGNFLNYEFRMHDSRVGRFFAIDPLEKKYPHYTPYSFSGNKVIAFTELEGQEEYDVKTLTERMDKVLIKFQTKADIIAKDDLKKREEYQEAIEGFENDMKTFLNNDRLLSAYSLLRYGEGEGGKEFYNLDLLKESSTFKRGYEAVIDKIEFKAEEFLKDENKKLNYTSYVANKQIAATMLSDVGTTLGSYGLKFNVGMQKFNKGEEVLIKGTAKITLADTYRWDEKRKATYSYLGFGDHGNMYLLLDLGAKPFSIRTYFTAKFTFNDSFFNFDNMSYTSPESLENDCETSCYPEISKDAGYSLQPGGEKADYRVKN